MKAELERKAIERLKAFEPEDGYYLCYSGGKDSDVIKILAHLADVNFEAVHNLTTVDAPETVNYIRSQADVRIDYPELSMWRLIEKKLMPPTRLIRYCCSELKERGGKGKVKITGVRWDESNNRKENGGLVKIIGKPKTMQRFADENDVNYNIVVDRVCSEKPPAIVYIDDRAICFDGKSDELLEKIEQFTPYYQKRAVAEFADNEIKKELVKILDRCQKLKYGARKKTLVDAGLLKNALQLINVLESENEVLTKKLNKTADDFTEFVYRAPSNPFACNFCEYSDEHGHYCTWKEKHEGDNTPCLGKHFKYRKDFEKRR